MHCLDCDYPLVHLKDNRCPECGRQFDPQDPSTYRPLDEIARTQHAKQEIKGTLAAVIGVLLIGMVFFAIDLSTGGNGFSCCFCGYLGLTLVACFFGVLRIIRIRSGFKHHDTQKNDAQSVARRFQWD